MEASNLDLDSIRAGFFEDGFYVLPGVFSSDQCQRVRAHENKLLELANGSYRPFMQPHRECPEIRSLMAEPVVVRVMQHLIGPDVSGLQSQYFFGKPGTQGFTPHQDASLVGADGACFASAWTALEDIDAENGCLRIYEGTHKMGLLGIEEARVDAGGQQDYNAVSHKSVVPEGVKKRLVEVKAGSTIFIHGFAVHDSLSNASNNRPRPALLMTYIQKGQPFRPGAHAKRHEIDVQASS